MQHSTENEGINLETYNSLAPKVGKEVDKDNVLGKEVVEIINDELKLFYTYFETIV